MKSEQSFGPFPLPARSKRIRLGIALEVPLGKQVWIKGSGTLLALWLGPFMEPMVVEEFTCRGERRNVPIKPPIPAVYFREGLELGSVDAPVGIRFSRPGTKWPDHRVFGAVLALQGAGEELRVEIDE